MRNKLLLINSKQVGIVVAILSFTFLIISLNSCSVTLVQPFDEKLLSDTDAFYKISAEVIIQGETVSPRYLKDVTINSQHPAHYSKFEQKYNSLIVSVDALILRAMSGSQKIDTAGKYIQEKLTKLVEASIPTYCPELRREIGTVSLTAQNFVDLKCMILKWKEDHKKAGIVKKGLWEGRKRTLFNLILAIQSAERFKKEK